MQRLFQKTLAETVAAARLVYMDSSNNQYRTGKCDGTAEEANVVGFANEGNTATNPDDILTNGLLEVNGGLTVDTAYYLAADGKIKEEGDLVATERVVFIGWAISTTQLDVSIKNFQREVA